MPQGPLKDVKPKGWFERIQDVGETAVKKVQEVNKSVQKHIPKAIKPYMPSAPEWLDPPPPRLPHRRQPPTTLNRTPALETMSEREARAPLSWHQAVDRAYYKNEYQRHLPEKDDPLYPDFRKRR